MMHGLANFKFKNVIFVGFFCWYLWSAWYIRGEICRCYVWTEL